jgi:hypothetical protein
MDMEWELRCRLIDIFLSTFVHSRHDLPLTGGKRCSDEDMIGRTYILYRTFCIYHFLLIPSLSVLSLIPTPASLPLRP